jgi:hypothetical protein
MIEINITDTAAASVITKEFIPAFVEVLLHPP